jgi:choline dehydrogenase-like flavoprotein
MKLKVDYLLIGTGVAPLLAAQRLTQRGDSVVILNPDYDFFLEDSELPLDLLSFETTNTDLSRRFSNNLPEQVYRDLIPEFPGAIELSREEDLRSNRGDYRVEEAPWIRSRHRMWVAPGRGPSRERLEVLYLRALDLGWKPQWLEGWSLARRFPGFSTRNLESRDLADWAGFIGPRLGDIDVSRYRTGLLEFVRERLGRENVLTSVHLLHADERGVRFQRSHGQPSNIEIGRAVLHFWTPKMERMLRQTLERVHPRSLRTFNETATLQHWEEWDLLSRDPVNAFVVGHLESLRIWSHGEGPPPPAGWSRIKVMRREKTDRWVGEQSFQELSRLLFQFMGWDRFTVRRMNPRSLYRWNQNSPIEMDADGIRNLIIPACDGPLHWIASHVRKAIDGV